MHSTSGDRYRRELAARDPADPRYVPGLVELLLAEAHGVGASDVHVQPAAEGLEIRWRIDGVLHGVGMVPATLAPNVVARLKVLADLLTYRTDVPQEGRVRDGPGPIEMRVSTFPTLFG
ncbi:MAG TPA: ATPase, T2SS/T4P/T4SS family, partial [Isosphaeraceae bacterium]